jgi:2-methylisocitrate lyase-like PEP mutase family enzyme
MHDPVEAFRQLHRNPQPLILANAWDPASARIVENLGAPAVATTSAGVAWSLGYADGNRMPAEQLVRLVRDIVRVIRIPLSVDIEAGYSGDPQAVGDIVKSLLAIGAAGINIEDGRDAPELLAAKIRRVRQVADHAGVKLFINARTDVYLQQLVPEADRLGETVARAVLYKAAGADGLFVPGAAGVDMVSAIATRIDMPLNVMAWPGNPPAAELAKAGVRRISAGSAISQVIWAQVEKMARDFLETGHSEPLSEGLMPYGKLQGLFADRR